MVPGDSLASAWLSFLDEAAGAPDDGGFAIPNGLLPRHDADTSPVGSVAARAEAAAAAAAAARRATPLPPLLLDDRQRMPVRGEPPTELAQLLGDGPKLQM